MGHRKNSLRRGFVLMTVGFVFASAMLIPNVVWRPRLAAYLVLVVAIRAAGRAWEMWSADIPIRGGNLVPFLGSWSGSGDALTVYQGARVALVGPMWSLGGAVISLMLFFLTQKVFLVEFAILSATIGVLELFPFLPFDGGEAFRLAATSYLGHHHSFIAALLIEMVALVESLRLTLVASVSFFSLFAWLACLTILLPGIAYAFYQIALGDWPRERELVRDGIASALGVAADTETIIARIREVYVQIGASGIAMNLFVASNYTRGGMALPENAPDWTLKTSTERRRRFCRWVNERVRDASTQTRGHFGRGFFSVIASERLLEPRSLQLDSLMSELEDDQPLFQFLRSTDVIPPRMGAREAVEVIGQYLALGLMLALVAHMANALSPDAMTNLFHNH